MSCMRLFVVVSFMFLLAGCSNLNISPPVTAPAPVRQLPARVVKPTLPKIPEIKAPVVIKPYQYKRAAVIKRPPVVRKPKYKVKPKPKYKAPVVSRYPRSITAPTIKVAPQVGGNKKSEPIGKTENVPPKDIDVGLDIDPYANIPENAEDKGTGRSASSPAVEALLVRAYADAKLGRTDAAMIKLERGLRIEPQNPKLWNQLAELHYKKGNYQQAITMAKKAISLSSNDEEMTGKNWKLLSKVAEKSGNSQILSEADEYNKRH